jgi:hypothetical protein
MKVYCTGWHKTGTTSLAEALRVLGYNVCDDAYRFPPQGETFDEMVDTLLRGYDGFADMPWPVLAPQIMREHPDWYFVHTVRPVEDWWESAETHFSGTTHPVREWAYGEPDPSEAPSLWRRTYVAHNKQIEALSGEVEHFLRLPLQSDNKMERLSTFLGRATPPMEYPHKNQNATQAGAICTSI